MVVHGKSNNGQISHIFCLRAQQQQQQRRRRRRQCYCRSIEADDERQTLHDLVISVDLSLSLSLRRRLQRLPAHHRGLVNRSATARRVDHQRMNECRLDVPPFFVDFHLSLLSTAEHAVVFNASTRPAPQFSLSLVLSLSDELLTLLPARVRHSSRARRTTRAGPYGVRHSMHCVAAAAAAAAVAPLVMMVMMMMTMIM